MISAFFPNDKEHLIKYNCFSQVKVEHYHKTVREGEKTFGRTIYLEDILKKPGEFRMYCIKSINFITERKFKYVGF